MKCKDCPKWKGTSYSEWGDCYRIIFYMEPGLCECSSSVEGLHTLRMREPFDPHDIKYFTKNNKVKKLLRKIKKELPDGVRCININKLDFFQTQRNFKCIKEY